MAVSAVRGVGRTKEMARPVRGSELCYVKDGRVWPAVKLGLSEFDHDHREAIANLKMSASRELLFDVPGWRSTWIGAGEEKAVFLVVDPQGRAFAIELLAKGTYLQGHLAEGHYFAEIYVPGLSNFRWNTHSFFDHVFSGIVKVREFVYGDTLAGPGLRVAPVKRASIPARLLHKMARNWVTWVVTPRYYRLRKRYRDAHEANVMIELLPLANPENKSHYLLPIPWLEEDGRLHLRYYRLTPIDVRAR